SFTGPSVTRHNTEGTFQDSTEADEPRPGFTEHTPSFKTLPNLSAKLPLKHVAAFGEAKLVASEIASIGCKDDLFLRKKVDLSLCRDGPVEVISNPTTDSTLRFVERRV